MNRSVLIVGAGLTGLVTAYRLQRLGFNVTLIEARDRIGGRIYTVQSGHTRVEMGATWFNESHTHLLELIKEFEIPYAEQFLTGISYFQTFSNVPPQEITVPKDSPSYLFENGTINLLKTIYSKLNSNTVHFNEPVLQLDFQREKVHVITTIRKLEVDVVITTLPPALLLQRIKFSPELPNEISSLAKQTHTWMQDSIKIAFTYKTPFWREQGKSGTIFSNTGPLTEFYDQSNMEKHSYALVGFASGSCARLTKEKRIEKIEAQLISIFGEEALAYESYHELLWTQEEFTKSSQQLDDLFPHQNGGNSAYKTPLYDDRLFISGSETSPHHSGYMEGAVFAAETNLKMFEFIN